MKNLLCQLSKYYYHENDLSNIVVALCNSDEEFRKLFIGFFFPKLPVGEVSSIEREVPDPNDAGSRVDIYITLKSDPKPYLVEVKIGDQNHHFGQYEEAYEIDKSRLGYITNYHYAEGLNLGYDVKTWRQFYEACEASEVEAAHAFMPYLKSVCSIVTYNDPMKFSNLQTIPQFIDTVKDIVEKESFDADVAVEKLYMYRDSAHQAISLSYPDINSALSTWIYISLWFQTPPVITFCAGGQSWLAPLVQGDSSLFSDSEYWSEPYTEYYWSKNDTWCDLKPSALQKFKGAETYGEQREMMKAFIADAIARIKPLFKNYKP